ncbi:alpha/beta fold hydrolase [Microcella sp.]|uniref:alpha/beta hydrolase n=1 Tax=Microcella sp. TaxID=1913979 RepID=UPI0039192A22
MTTPTSDHLMAGITARDVDTARLRVRVLERAAVGEEKGVVVFVHGNVSSSLFYQPTMLALDPAFRALALDLRGFGETERLPVDATRGLGDFADDVIAALDALGVERAHFVGWSMGGGVVMRIAIDNSHRVASLCLESPVSPYGFGGTRLDGSLLTPDAAGTGGGGANPDFVARLAANDTSDESPTSPRNVYRGTYVADASAIDNEDLWVHAMLTTATGEENYPGDATASESWPGFAPGTRGVLNTMAPTHCDLSGLVNIAPKPPITWIRGSADAIVSDASLFDLNHLGALGAIPGWPGADVAPAQPMVSQTRVVLERYAAGSPGLVDEVVFDGCGHSPHLERPSEFIAALHALLDRARAAGDA